ncbi:hypothetical protein [Mesorhizobium sp. B2-4-8]|uniref:hypothetical protein n=1 Tax=Mesorhizobium sp. B2-4-8 TaxID=2589941 RepID=UPI00112A63FE|nr:hypothetical protein [Mesorhizobium sp. B2-4-8]TPL36748.1 hypothetical protein FJ947_10870 [Mesorhizobium sp. B2-4-8]
MKWLVGAACVAVIAAVGYYFTGEYVAYAASKEQQKVAADMQFCERSLEQLKSYRAGTASANAAISEQTSEFIVSGCAEKNAAYALKAVPYLSN